MKPSGRQRRGAPAAGTSWSSGEDDTAGEARTTADELHGVESQKHPTFRGHPGSGHATPKDEQRRNLRALRKLKDAEPEPEPPAHHSPAVDPLVMRKIQTDLDKLARRKNERERSRRRVRAREEKDSDRGASRLTGAGVNERIVRTPLVVSGVDAETSTPTASMRKDAVGNTAYETPSTRDAHASRGERSHKAQSPFAGSGSRRGSFVGVAYALDSEDEETPGSAPFETARDRERWTASSPRLPTPPPFAKISGETPDSLRYMEVMSRYLSTRGVHASLLDELEEDRDRSRGDAPGGPGDLDLDSNDGPSVFSSRSTTALARSASDATMDDDIAAEALASFAAGAEGGGARGGASRSSNSKAEFQSRDGDPTTPRARSAAAEPSGKNAGITPDASRRGRPPSHRRTPSGSRDAATHASPASVSPGVAIPGSLSPLAAPFDFDRRARELAAPGKTPPSERRDALAAPEPRRSPEPFALSSSLAASIEHMRGASALSPADRAFAAAAVDAGASGDEKDGATHSEAAGEDDADVTLDARLRRERFAAARAALRAETPPPGSEEADTAEGIARLAARRAGVALRNALDAAVAAAVDGESTLGDAQHASADVLYELERTSDACALAVARAASSPSPEAAALAVVTHARLSGVVLEEVSSVASHAAWALRELSRSLRATSEAEASAGEAAEEAAAAAVVEKTGDAVEAAARADREADAASADAAAALVRAAYAGAWVAQHLGVYSRWAKRASSWAGHPPPPPPPQPDSPHAAALREAEAAGIPLRLCDPEAASEAADAVYARAVHDVVVSWAGYIGASAAAAPPEDEAETPFPRGAEARNRDSSRADASAEDVSADDEEEAFWGGAVPPGSRAERGGAEAGSGSGWESGLLPGDTEGSSEVLSQRKAERPAPARARADPATRRAFLRSLWVQAFIAQSCVQGAFSTPRVARFAKSGDGFSRDFDQLVRAAMRVIAVATTVERQLAAMGPVGSEPGGEPAFGKMVGARLPDAGASASADGAAGTTSDFRTARPHVERKGASFALPFVDAVEVSNAKSAPASPERALVGSQSQFVAPLAPRSPPRGPGDRSAVSAADALASSSVDYIDALWTSVSQVKTLKFEKAIKIGRGGFSTVLRATWRGSTVAVKVLDPKKINGDVVDAIKREVTTMTANRHPHIVTVLAASVQLPDASIIMEHCLHGSLSDVLARARTRPARLCWRVRTLMASDAACGLAFLHSSSNQIAHRDFNTSNLLVTEDMRVKIADFGLSRLVRAATCTASGTSGTSGKENEADGVANAGAANATVSNAKVVSDPGDPEGFGLRNCLFHAPEVIAAGAGGSFGTRADVFSFGVVLWCLATLAPPWEDVQAEHEHLPELARFYQTMRAVAKKVAAGERLPLDALRSADTRVSANKQRSPDDPDDGIGIPSFAFAGNTARYAELIELCFSTDPSARPSMTRALRALRKMRRDETAAEFAEFPVPDTWAGFAPVAVPHMSAARRTEPAPEPAADRSEARDARAAVPAPSGVSTPSGVSETANRMSEKSAYANATGARLALLVAATAAASFSAGRFWSSRLRA